MKAADLDDFLDYRSDPDVGRYQSWEKMDRDQARGFITAAGSEPLLQPGRWSQVAIADAQSDALIGDMGVRIEADQSEAELGITLSTPAQGHGFGLAAVALMIDVIFTQTPVRKIWAITDARNARSLSLIKRAGFTFSHTEEDKTQAPVLIEHFFTFLRPGS